MRAERSVLFGVVAVQNSFIDRQALVEGLRAWSHDKDRTLGEILIELGLLEAADRELLETLVEKQLHRHAGDFTESLAPFHALRQDLASIADDEIEATLPPRSSSLSAEEFDLALVGTSAGHGAGIDTSRAIATEDGRAVPANVPTTPASRFTIVRPHAEGGIGQVSVAIDGEFAREVALKEIKPAFSNDRQSQARFLLEAEITGGLEHPGIVPVYSLGKYPNGRPYYAMRLIRGQSLRDTCDEFHQRHKDSRKLREWNLELRKLLGRFVDVCNAIDYAHSRGVLHRDIKPANIMLGRFGETLVVDWGLAKVLGASACMGDEGVETTLRPPAQDGTDPTVYGFAVGTVAYMPPEQAAGHLDFLGPTSDVYSLGATLYYVLTGQAPFTQAHPEEDVRARVVQGLFVAPRKIVRHIGPPLEAICMKAMSRDPRERYQSARELADDIEHYLADEPVKAHREPIRERLSRVARRHKSWTQAIAAALVFVALISAAAVFEVTRERNAAVSSKNEALVARQEEEVERKRANLNAANEKAARIEAVKSRDVAETAQKRAEHAAAVAQQVSGFLIGLFQGADPITIGGSKFASGRQLSHDVTAREIVDLGAEILLQDTAMEPAIRATLMDQIGAVYLSLGKYDEADRQISEALRLRREFLSSDHPQLAESLIHAGTLKHLLGYYEDAELLLREALAILDKPDAEPTFEQSTAYIMLAWTLAEAHRADEGEVRQHAERALAIRTALAGDSSRDVGTVYLVNGIIEAMLGNMPGFLENAVRVAEIWRALPGGEHVEQALLQAQSMMVAIAADNSERASTHARKASQEIRDAFGNDSPLTLSLLWALAYRLAVDGQEFQVANELLDGIDADIRLMFRGHPRLSHYLTNRIYIKSPTPQASAIALYEESITLLEELVRKNPNTRRFQEDLANQYAELAELQSDLGHAEDALSSYDRLLTALHKLPSSASGFVIANTHLDIGLVNLSVRRVEQAIHEMEKARILLAELVHSAPQELEYRAALARCHNNLAAAYRDSLRFEDSLEANETALAMWTDLSQLQPLETNYKTWCAISLRGMGTTLARCGRMNEAIARYRQSLALLETLLAANPSSTEFVGQLAFSLDRLAWIQATDETASVLDGSQAVAGATRACTLTAWEKSSLIDTLAAAYAEMGNFEKAIEHEQKALELAMPGERAAMEARLELYRSGKPYREPLANTSNPPAPAVSTEAELPSTSAASNDERINDLNAGTPASDAVKGNSNPSLEPVPAP